MVPANSITVTPSELKVALMGAFKAGLAPMVHGDPGIGKSDIFQQVADEMFGSTYDCVVDDAGVWSVSGKGKATVVYGPSDLRPWFIDERAAQLDALDTRGLPGAGKDGNTVWLRPESLPTDTRGGIIFYDEINRGQESTMNALFQIILSKRSGRHTIPSNWLIGSAVNDKDTGARKMSSALLSRFIHFNLVADVDDSVRFATLNNWHPAVIAFMKYRPALLHAYDPSEKVSPNPRAWSFVSRIIAQDYPRNVEHAMFGGVVGIGAATEFSAFLRLYRQLPSIDAILADPEGTMVPSEPSACYAVACALARFATVKNFKAALTYLNRMGTEYGVVSVTDAVRRKPELQATQAFGQWAKVNSSVML